MHRDVPRSRQADRAPRAAATPGPGRPADHHLDRRPEIGAEDLVGIARVEPPAALGQAREDGVNLRHDVVCLRGRLDQATLGVLVVAGPRQVDLTPPARLPCPLLARAVGRGAGRDRVRPPAGGQSRLCGEVPKLRYTWPDPTRLLITGVSRGDRLAPPPAGGGNLGCGPGRRGG